MDEFAEANNLAVEVGTTVEKILISLIPDKPFLRDSRLPPKERSKTRKDDGGSDISEAFESKYLI